jgi:hypothetical protein
LRIDKPEISGLLVLFIGVGLLAFTFLNAYWFLSEDVSIVASQDLVRAFGEALAPLIGTVIHIMYLGIMGWIGSLLTLRGIPLLTHPKTPITQPVLTQTQVPIKKEQKEKQQPPKPPEIKEEPKKEPQKQPEKPPEKKPEAEKPAITIEVRPPEEVAAEPPQKPSTPPAPSQSP